MIMKKQQQQQAIFLTIKKKRNLPLHYKTCKSCPFHDTFLNIDKMNVLINLIVLTLH